MAKTTKTAKRSVAPSKNKNSLLARSFNLKSRKVQFFVTILVIAIVGGGYMTIKSFASNQLALVSAQSGTLTGKTNSNNCKTAIVSDNDKSGSKVLVLGCNPLDTRYTPGQAYSVSPSYGQSVAYVYSQYAYRVCAIAKGTGTLGLGTTRATVWGGDVKINSSQYQTYCSSTYRQDKSDYSGPYAILTQDSTNQLVSLSSLWIEQMTATPAGTTGGK